MRLYSADIWNVGTGELSAGELGYLVRSGYTSLTRFTAEDSAGLVQLASLGQFLLRVNFGMWDLGMELDYKIILWRIK